MVVKWPLMGITGPWCVFIKGAKEVKKGRRGS